MHTATYTHHTWPELSYEKFIPTSHLLHMCVQALGKLKLLTPFEPEWANVILPITTRGLTTGLIPAGDKNFSIDIDFIQHRIITQSTTGKTDFFDLKSMSVAELIDKIFQSLKNIDIMLTINTKPQEIPNPILFEQDTEVRSYNPHLAHAWWQILVSSYVVIQRFHALFRGKTQPIGLMWGTFDLRDIRFKNSVISIPTTGPNAGYLRRNALDSDQIEFGWWSGNDACPRPAYYSFTYPEPAGIAEAKIQPKEAHWDHHLKLFILNYDDVRKSANPAQTLFSFLQSTYEAGAKIAGWDPELIGSGKPV